MADSVLIERPTGQLGPEDTADLVVTMAALERKADEVLSDNLLGICLTGSFALGGGDLASDVDFLVVSHRPLVSGDEAAIARLHAAFPDRPGRWARHLEGSWVDTESLRDPVGVHAPWLYVDHGSRAVELSRHDDSWNSRWVVRHRGIPVRGPAAAELVPAVAPQFVKDEAVDQAMAKTRWVEEAPEALSDPWAQPYLVLTYCRLLWSSTFGTVATKSEAARLVSNSPSGDRFRDLIGSAVVHRLTPLDKAAQAHPSRVELTREFVEWATGEVTERATVENRQQPSSTAGLQGVTIDRN